MTNIVPDNLPVLRVSMKNRLIERAAIRFALRFPDNRVLRKTYLDDINRDLAGVLLGDLSIAILDAKTGRPLMRTVPGFYKGAATWE